MQKKPFQFWTNPGVIVTVLVATLIGTYLDLYFVGKGLYSFPARPFSDSFTIHVGFTLIGLPLMVIVFLLICQKLNVIGKCFAVIVLAVIMSVFEKLSELFGLFVHDPSWMHVYSFFGYAIYLSLILIVYELTKKPDSC